MGLISVLVCGTPTLAGQEYDLAIAASNGDLATVKRFLAAGANPNLIVSPNATVLIMAAQNGHLDVVTALLAAKADPNAKRPV